MYIKTIKATYWQPEESELIEEPGEAAALFIQAMYDDQELKSHLYVPDDISEEEIELELSDYFSSDILDLPWGEREITKDEMESCQE